MSKEVSLLEAVIELAQEMEFGDPIDFADLQITEESAYNLIATKIVEETMLTDKDHRELMLMASITHLAVENFILNQRILKASRPFPL